MGCFAEATSTPTITIMLGRFLFHANAKVTNPTPERLIMETDAQKPNDSISTRDDAGGDCVNRLVRLLRWAIINALMAWCAWEAVINGVMGAGRILAFVAWGLGPLMFLSACIPDVKNAAAKRGRPIPAWLSHGYGLTLLLFLVWHGWWWTSIAVLLAEIGEAAVFSKPNASLSLPRDERG